MSLPDTDDTLSLLLVDDDAADRQAVQHALRSSGLPARVVEAASGAEAMGMLSAGGFDCVLLDYQLPGPDGLELIQWLRAAGIRTPVIMLTAQSDALAAAALMKAGASDYLAKAQLTPAILASGLRSAMRVQRAEALAAEALAQRRQADLALRHSRHLLATTLHSIGEAVITTDAAGAISFMNAVAERLTGWSSAEATGHMLDGILPMIVGDTGERLPGLVDHVLRSGAMVERVNRILVEDRHGRRFPVTGSAAPIKDTRGDPLGVVLVLRDVIELVRSEGRMRLLAELSQSLAASLDYREHLTSLACLVVPDLADCCAIDLLSQQGEVERVALAGAPPRLAALGDDLLAVEHAVGEVAPDPFAHARAAQGPLAALRVPLPVRGAIRGAITLVRAGAQGPFDADDSALAEEMARRAGLAIEHALLYREAQEAIQIRDTFLSVASHELKTPLTSLLGYLDLLKRRVTAGMTLGERELRRIEIANTQAHRLYKMVTSLLDLSRLQMGQLSIERVPVDLRALTRRISEEIEPALDRHQLSISLPDEAVIIAGDELRLEQVLHNLLSNAAKYSPYGGPISIRLSTEASWARLVVQDQGLGIPREALEHIFTRFYRADNSAHLQVAGIGVGLFVVKQIMDLHGGRVEVESVESEGSSFTLWLPLSAMPKEAGTPGNPVLYSSSPKHFDA